MESSIAFGTVYIAQFVDSVGTLQKLTAEWLIFEKSTHNRRDSSKKRIRGEGVETPMLLLKKHNNK
jgi:hypothetical protein